MVYDSDHMEASALQEDLEKIQNDIKKDVVASEEQMEVYEEVETIVENHDMLLDKENITEDDVKVANESLYYALGRAGLNKKEMSYFKISSEQELTNRQKILISREGLVEVLKTIYNKIIEILKAVWNKLKEWYIKISNWATKKSGKLNSIKLKCYDNKLTPIGELDNEVKEKMVRWFSSFLYINNNSLDIDMICDYITMNSGNPFIDCIPEIQSLSTDLINNQSTVEKTNRIVQKVKQNANKSYIHRKIVDVLEKIYKDINVCYVYSTKGYSFKYYASVNAQMGEGFNIDKFKHELTELNGTKNFIINRANKYGDLIPIIDNLIKLSENSNKYFNSILELNKKATDSIKEIRKKLESNINNITYKDKEIIRKNANFLKSLGTDLVFSASEEYTWYISKLTTTLEILTDKL